MFTNRHGEPAPPRDTSGWSDLSANDYDEQEPPPVSEAGGTVEVGTDSPNLFHYKSHDPRLSLSWHNAINNRKNEWAQGQLTEEPKLTNDEGSETARSDVSVATQFRREVEEERLRSGVGLHHRDPEQRMTDEEKAEVLERMDDVDRDTALGRVGPQEAADMLTAMAIEKQLDALMAMSLTERVAAFLAMMPKERQAVLDGMSFTQVAGLVQSPFMEPEQMVDVLFVMTLADSAEVTQPPPYTHTR